MINSGITKKQIKDLTFKDDILTDISVDYSRITQTQLPFVDYMITSDSSVSVTDFTVNNIILSTQYEYGKIPDYGFDIDIVIPSMPPSEKAYSEFYVNFLFTDAITADIEFRLSGSGAAVDALAAEITANRTYHMFEDADGKYTVDFLDNTRGAVAQKT